MFYMTAGLIVFMNRTSGFASIIYGSASIITGVLLYLLLSTLAIDLLNLIVNIHPVFHGILVLSITALISIYGIWNAFNLRITERSIELSGLNENIKAIHLSDIHLGHFRGQTFMQKLVDEVNEQNPDVIFITGDLFDGKKQINEDVFSPIKDLRAPIYFVEGNHDIYSGVDRIKTFLKDIGIHVLENEIVSFKGLQIIGLNHMRPDNETYDMHTQKGKTIKGVLPFLEINDSQASVLLHHSPDGIKYANENGIDLYLSGHTHAGQLFPGNLIVRLAYKYNRGEYSFKDLKIIVSEGTGSWGPPMRVGTKSEIIVLNLKKK